MNYETFRDMTREEKDKLLYELIVIMSHPKIEGLLNTLITMAKSTKEPLVFSKEKSILNYHGLNIDFPDLPKEIEEMSQELNGLKVLGMMLLDPSDHYCKAQLTADDITELLGNLPKFFNEAASKRDDGLDMSIEQSALTIYGEALRPMPGFKLTDKGVLSFYGDPDMHPLAVIWYEDDMMLMYENSWVVFAKKSASAESPKPANVYRLI